jgi:DNA-3-methyladenine glycosylase I
MTQPSPTFIGQDRKRRCGWCSSDPLYIAYHDNEWGRPVTDDNRLYEKLCLEGFQAGLSWLTILKKREAFREAFAGFDPLVVARFTTRDVQRLMRNAGIVRNTAKIQATIANARATIKVWDAGMTLSDVIWRHQPSKRRAAPRGYGDIPSFTPESTALSKELSKLGFRFVGPTTMYAALQSLGVVNDHYASCAFRSAGGSGRSRLTRGR